MKKYFFFFTALLLTIGFIEIFAQVIFLLYPFEIEQDPILHHRLKKSIIPRIHHHAESKKFLLYVNKNHWPEKKDIPPKKNPGTKRIFFIGDSNTEGPVPYEKKMTELLKVKKLPNDIEIINTGTTSYSTIIYYVLSKEIIIKYKPDIVMICYDMTDVPQDSFYKQAAVFDKKGLPLRIKGDYIGSDYLTPFGGISKSKNELFIQKLKQHSKLVFFIDKIAKKIKINPFAENALSLNTKKTSPVNWLSITYSPEVNRNIQWSMQLLGETIDFYQSQGVKVIVMGVPFYNQFTGELSSKPHQILSETTQEHKALYLNLYEKMKPYVLSKEPNYYYFITDKTHLNTNGHKLWSEILFSFLKEKKLVD
jgi:hypothetical protein